MTIRTITSHILDLNGAAKAGDSVTFRLSSPYHGVWTATEHVPSDVITTLIDASGNITIPLYCPATYLCTVAGVMAFQIIIPDDTAPTTLEALHASSGTLPEDAENILQTLIDAHVAAADPHAVYLTQGEGDARYGLLAHTQAWSTITATPTTLAGYGITDAYTKTAADARYAPIAVPFASLTGKPTTLAGYGITDGVLTSDARLSDARVPLAHTQAFSTITSTPTTLAGYGIADSLTAATAAATYSVLAHIHTFASLTSKPTTLAGYGIADAYTTTQVDSADALKANLAGGNALTGAQVLSSSAVGVKPLVVKGFSGQTANEQEWQDSAGTVKLSVSAGGNLVTANTNVQARYFTDQGNTIAYMDTDNDTTHAWTLYNATASKVPLTIKAAASQTANQQEWQDSAGVVKASIANDGRVLLGNSAGAALSGSGNDTFVSAHFNARFGVWCESFSGTVRQTGFDAAADATILNFKVNNVNNILNLTSTGNIGVATTTQFGGGSGVIGIKNATTPPASTPSSGGVLYSESGSLKWKGSSGTVTVLAVA